jgi:aminopeptidase YwaD
LLNADTDKLIKVQNRGALYAYEIVNFVDGKRTVVEIRDAVAGELGPIPLAVVSDYLKACEEAQVIAFR